MVVLRLHRRAASVPVGGEPPVSEDTNFAAQNSYLFSRAAIDNTDALSTASKRNDQQFLRDVNSLIGSSSSNQPYVKTINRTHHGHPSAYPLTAGRRRSIAVSSVLRPPPHLSVADTSTDADVDYEVKLLAPLTHRLSRYGGGGGGRAASVPPQPVTLTPAYHHYHHQPIVTKQSVLYTNGPILVDGGYHQTPSIYDLQLQSQPAVTHHHDHGRKLNPVADLAVRQAHRNLDRIESELKSSGDDVISAPRTLLYRNYSPGVLRRSSSYHGPRSSTVRTRSPSPVSVVGPVRRTTVRSIYTPSDAELYTEYLPSSTLKRNIETDLLLASNELNSHPTHVYSTKTGLPVSYYLPSYSSYSTLPSSVRRSIEWDSGPVDKVIIPNLHQNGPDRYGLPPSGILTSSVLRNVSTGSGHSAPVVIHSVSPDVHALTLHSYTTTPHSVHTTPSTYTTFSHAPQKPPVVPRRSAPLPPAQATTSTGFQNVGRPKVSDTRRKVRDVLCKVKGDPHYFDD